VPVAFVEAIGITSPCCPGGRGMSSAGEFSVTTLSGVDQGDARVARWETQMSLAPTPPGRSEPNHRVRPSVEIAELVSKELPLTTVTGAGVPNGAVAVGRVANQTSPLPLTRSVVK